MPIHDWSRVPAGVFHSFHIAWLDNLQKVMNNGLLPEPYYALAEPVLGDAVPDVLTLQASGQPIGPEGTGGSPTRAVSLSDDTRDSAVALAPSPVIVKDLTLEPYDLLARRITVRSEWEGDNVVAVIELVSRANKVSQEKAERFVQKSLSFLAKGIHLLLIDVQPPTPTLRTGFHVKVCEQCGEVMTGIPPERVLYAVSFQVLEGGKARSHVAPLKVGDALPEMAIFLLPHRFVRLPLETTYSEAFESLPRKFRETLTAPG
jgi:hypothetical protein